MSRPGALTLSNKKRQVRAELCWQLVGRHGANNASPDTEARDQKSVRELVTGNTTSRIVARACRCQAAETTWLAGQSPWPPWRQSPTPPARCLVGPGPTRQAWFWAHDREEKPEEGLPWLARE
jgi:hypothetical protein